MLRPSFGLFVLLIGCSPIADPGPSSPNGPSSGPPTLVKSSYAAMEEVPVKAGELRLAEPIEVEVDLEVEVEVDGTEVAADTTGDQPATDDPRPAKRKVTAIGFPLEHTDVSAQISGMIGHYTVTQTFQNPYATPLEAVYVFPLGAKAAVVDYEIVIGDRTVKGEIKTREKARQIYEEAKRSGHTTALLEQDKPNVFTQAIANIAPGEEIQVRFKYIEMLEYKDNTYEIVYPMVVGPRYLPLDRPGRRPVSAHVAGSAGGAGNSIPYVRSERAGATISFAAQIDAGVPIISAASPTHDVSVSGTDTLRAIKLIEKASIPNRDLVLRYSAAGRQTMVGAMTHRVDGQDGYFSLVIQPKAKYTTRDIRGREVVILIDKSGSMRGEPMGQARALAKALLGTLSAKDTFNVVTFASGTDSFAPSPAIGDESAKKRGIQWVDSVRAGGATEMERGIMKSLATKPGNDRVRMVYVLSDGFVGNDDVILEAARKYLGHNRIYPIGIGSSPNRFLFDRLGDVGRGYTSYLLPRENASELATSLVRRSAHPYLTDIEIDWAGLDVTDVTPARLPDIHAGLPLTVSGRYRKPGQATIRLKAYGGDRQVEIPLAIALPHTASRPAVRYLWARERVAELMGRDYGNIASSTQKEVTEIGLAYRMVTEYTSFVAVDRRRVVEGGQTKTVVVPVPVPAGVDIESAVGPAPAPRPQPSVRSRRRSGGGGGGGWGGGDTDPFTLLYLLLLLPSIIMLRRMRTS